MRLFALGCLAVVAATGCKLLKKKEEPPPTISITSVGPGTGRMKGKVRVEESHTPYDATVLVDGARLAYDTNGMWAPLSPAKTKPGKHTLAIEVVAKDKSGKEQRASTTADIEVLAENPEFTIAPVKRGGSSIHCLGCKPEYADYDKDLTVAFQIKASPGDSVEWDGKKLPPGGGPHDVTFRIAPALADTKVADVLDFYKGIRLPLTITTPEGGAGGRASLNGVDAAIAVFSRLAKGPVDIGDPDRGPGADRNALILSGVTSYKSKLVGKAEKIRDVDIVALFTTSEASRISCGTYANKAGQTGSHVIVALNVEVAIYDRRSARLKTKRTFRAPRATCPDTIYKSSSADFPTGDTAAAEKLVLSYVKS